METQQRSDLRGLADVHDIAEELERSLQTTWNARLVEYDAGAFDFAGWALERLRSYGYELEYLTETHRIIPSAEVHAVTKQLCADTALPAFRNMLLQLVWRTIVPEGQLVAPVAVQRLPNIRIFLPDKPAGTFPFHTGLLYGHGPASRSIWMPLTDVSSPAMRTASMQIIDVARSRELIAAARGGEWSVERMTDVFGKESRQCLAGPGSMIFFGQENLHGNFVNATGLTRVSIDFRLAEGRYGHLLARKSLGGYFHFVSPDGELDDVHATPNEAASTVEGLVVSYLSNNTSVLAGAPVHLQRLMLLEFCARHGIKSEFEFFELEGMAHLPTLTHLFEEIEAHVVLYSIFALPEDGAWRRRLLARALEARRVLFFVNEGVVMASDDDLQRIERYLTSARFGATPGFEGSAFSAAGAERPRAERGREAERELEG